MHLLFAATFVQIFINKNEMKTLKFILLIVFCTVTTLQANAHCDSYDGPVIKEAIKALQTNNVNLVYKWIDKSHEVEITSLFNKTYSLRNGDKEIYTIVEKHFLETLVRLHRETENAPFTGIKPAGQIPKIVQMSDNTVENGDIDDLLNKLDNHINSVVKEKFVLMQKLAKEKDTTPEKGREYVRAYVDFTHTVLGLHTIIDNTPSSCDH